MWSKIFFEQKNYFIAIFKKKIFSKWLRKQKRKLKFWQFLTNLKISLKILLIIQKKQSLYMFMKINKELPNAIPSFKNFLTKPKLDNNFLNK